MHGITILREWLSILSIRLLAYLAVIGLLAVPLAFSAAIWVILDKIAPSMKWYAPPMVFLLTGVGFIVHVRTRLQGMGPPYGFAMLLSFLIAVKLALMIPVGERMVCDRGRGIAACWNESVTAYERYIRGAPAERPGNKGAQHVID